MSKYSVYCKNFFCWSVLGFILLLTGCGASSINMRPPVDRESQLNNDGIVVARVINAGGSILPFNQLTITPKGINESEKNKYPRLLSLNDPSGSASLFASSVPAGEYSVDSVRSFYVIGEYFYSLWASGGIDLGVFKVAPGKITDLGTFIYYRKVEGDKYSDQLIRVPQTNNQMLVQHYRPFLSYNSAEILTWDDDGGDSDRMSNYVALAQGPTIFPKRYLSPTGSLFLLGKLGAILERTPEGEWRQDAVDANTDLNSISQDVKGQLLVGGEQGALFFKGEDGRWRDLSLGAGTEIGGVQLLASGEAVLYVVEKEIGVVLRGNPGAAKVTWRKELEYAVDKGWRDINGQSLSTGEPELKNAIKTKRRVISLQQENFLGQHYIRVGIQQAGFDKVFDILDKVDFKLFRVEQLNQLQYEVNFAGKMDRIIPAGKVNLGVKVAGFWSWTGKDSYHRYDEASKTWVDISTNVNNCPGVSDSATGCKIAGKTKRRISGFSFISTPIFMTPLKGFASVRSTAVGSGEREAFLIETTNGGKSWTKAKVEFPGKFCTDLVPEITDRILLYCGGVSGDFYESLDEGKTWKQVRQHQSF